MKLLHRINVYLAGVIEFRNPVTPFYEEKIDYRWYNAGRNLSNRVTFHFYEWRQA